MQVKIMRINFGYVAIAMKLENASPNRTITLKNLEKIDRSLWNGKVEALSRQNIANIMRILRYNRAYGVKVYRFTSKIIPMATHPEFENWEWKNSLKEDFGELGNVVRETEMRVSTHPDHFVLLNSPKEQVLESSIRDLDYHCSMFEMMGLGQEYKMVLHVGGMYKNKEDSIKRFYEGFSKLEDRIKKRLIIENDDKLYNIEDVLTICQALNIPMVLDIHHDMCNPSSYSVEDVIADIFNTWKEEKFPPKIHISSPKSETDIRSHHDYIDAEGFVSFLNKINGRVGDFDAVIEAKMKDAALFKLIEDLKKYEFINKAGDASIEV
jgi:UV DNA damage endonuclease